MSHTPAAFGHHSSIKSTRSNKSVFDAVVRHTTASVSKSHLACDSAKGSDYTERKSFWRTCCGLIRRRERSEPEPEFKPTVVLLRHSERLDYVDKKYKETEEGKLFPYDAPLTLQGWKLAEDAAEDLAKLNSEGLYFAAIATSPYRRCVETAVVIAKRLELPIVLDQEIGEVWEKKMGDHPWRSASKLKQLIDELQVPSVLNPLLVDGGYKLFGKKPQYPESLDKARSRMVVRFETYIRQSEELQQNFIICTHADGIAAACGMFERGCADVTKMDFCSRIIARRRDSKDEKGAEDKNTFAKYWKTELKGIQLERNQAEGATKKMNEYIHNMACEENEQMVAARREERTSTDKTFDAKLKEFLAQQPESPENEEVETHAETETPDTETSKTDTHELGEQNSPGFRESDSCWTDGDLAQEVPLPSVTRL